MHQQQHWAACRCRCLQQATPLLLRLQPPPLLPLQPLVAVAQVVQQPLLLQLLPLLSRLLRSMQQLLLLPMRLLQRPCLPPLNCCQGYRQVLLV